MNGRLKRIFACGIILTIILSFVLIIKPQATTTVAEGTSGTCTWTLDSDGLLLIAPIEGESGTLGTTYTWPWTNYKESIISIKFDGTIYGAGVCANMFSGCSNLTSINISGFNTENVTIIGNMFSDCSSITSLDLSNFDTSNVTTMWSMFSGCRSLTSLDLSNFDTTNVTNMSGMFQYCKGLTNLDLSNFDTSNVTNMNNMFSGCDLTNIDLSNFDTSNVTDMSRMFSGCSSLTNINLSNFDTLNVTNMSYMFSGCDLKNIDLSSFDTSNVINMSHMFSECKELLTLDISSFNTSNVTDMSHMFYWCTKLINLDLSNFNTSNVTDISKMFYKCNSLTSLDISDFNLINITSLKELFYECENLINLNLENFNTSNVIDMSSMFNYCKKLTELDVSNFDTSNVTNMSQMFGFCENLTSIDVSNFDTSNVTDMSSMFTVCEKITDLDLSNFDTSKVINMRGMFNFCESLTDLDLSNFDTQNVTNISQLFRFCTNLKSVDLSSFETTNVTDMSNIFARCTKLEEMALSEKFVNIEENLFSDIDTSIFTMICKHESEAEQFAIDNSIPYLIKPVIEDVVENEIYEDGVTPYVTKPVYFLEEVELYKNENKIEDYTKGNSITEKGEYKIVATDVLGNKNEVNFKVGKVLTGISVTTEPTKTNYIEEQDFNKAGMVITATYGVDTTSEITDYTITNGTRLTKGQTSITISYTEDGVTKTTTQAITVAKKSLDSIEITTAPDVITYIINQNFNPAGMVITALYDNGLTQIVPDYIVENGNNLTLDQTSVTINYTEDEITKTAEQSITVIDSDLAKIEITTEPTKTNYIEEQDFDPAGMVITATFENGITSVVTDYELTDDSNLEVGQESVRISYTINEITKEIEQPITVVKKQLSAIEITTPPTKTNYIEDQDFEANEMIVKKRYDNGKCYEITEYTIIDGTNLKAGQDNVTISYTEDEITKTTTQDITVVEKALEEIEITENPERTEYISGQNFEKTGMIISAVYDNGKTYIIDNYEILNGNNLTTDQENITISYTENELTKIVEVPITVVEAELTGIEITTEPTNTKYIEEQNFDNTGMIVTTTYNNGMSTVVTNYNIVNGENLEVGQTSVTIKYTLNGITKEVGQTITVEKKKLAEIQVTTEPTKTSYIEGQDFDKAGMIITATYDNETTEEIKDYSIVNGTDLKLEQNNITISYKKDSITKTTTQPIEVVARTLEGIEIINEPTRTTYVYGQDFETSGMVVRATYDNGKTEIVTNYTVENGNSLELDQNSITIKYTEKGVTKTAIQVIEVIEKQLVSIEVVKAPNKTTYNAGDKFNATGMVVAAVYSDGEITTIDNYTITNGAKIRASQKSVTISYTENGITKTVDQKIIVNGIGIVVTPYDPTPTPDPVDSDPVDPNPVDPDPADPNPADPNPADPNPAEPDPIEDNTSIFVENEKDYKVENDIINNIKTNTSVSDFEDKIKEEYEVKITENGETVTRGYVKTGMEVEIKDNEGHITKYTAVVKGDINGDGIADSKDTILIKAHRNNVITLSVVEKEAADINNDETINIVDSRLLLYHRAGVPGYSLNY